MLSEFDIIRRFFSVAAPGAVLGVGDDAALLQPVPGMELAVSCDMLVAGRHFPVDADPRQLGHKALAVNLSDMAAMGATPRWATLALALPEADEVWLGAFADGFFRLAREHAVDLVGGDTTHGPLNICVQVMGEVPVGLALRRGGARPGDDVWVSGTLGDAALALAHLQRKVALAPADAAACQRRLHAPAPRVGLGQRLLGVASGAIDVSDGLAADLGHVLAASGAAATLDWDAIPLSPVMRKFLAHPRAQEWVLAGGDDYELCFTAAAHRREQVQAAAAEAGVAVTRIGGVEAGQGLTVVGADGRAIELGRRGFDHFG